MLIYLCKRSQCYRPSLKTVCHLSRFRPFLSFDASFSAPSVPPVPPGHGKPSTQSRNLRRRKKRQYEREAALHPPPPPSVSSANLIPLGTTFPLASATDSSLPSVDHA